MGNLEYNEPKTLDVAFDLIADVSMNAAACQYGGFSLSEIDKLLAPYAEKSYNKYKEEFYNTLDEVFPDKVGKHWYYVAAENKLKAKKKFMSMISWLKVYEIEECDEQTVQDVLANPDTYIAF